MDTWVVPVLGGQPQRVLSNAEGLTWINAASEPSRVLFSELTGHGGQMSIVTSTESRANPRTVYLPQTEDGMAHRSYLSPDRKWMIAVEMQGSWLPCRLVPFDGSSLGKPVGPSPGQCTDAAWSPDGKWMYFSSNTGGGVHTWRQRFPDGTPEQVTFGATEEEGIHFAPDGRSFVTSIGTSQSTVWVHDSSGIRQITSEGYGFKPAISPDGQKLYYLVRGESTGSFISGRLWVADIRSGQKQRLLPEFDLQSYNISPTVSGSPSSTEPLTPHLARAVEWSDSAAEARHDTELERVLRSCRAKSSLSASSMERCSCTVSTRMAAASRS